MTPESEITSRIASLTTDDWDEISDMYDRVSQYAGPWSQTKGGDKLEPEVISMPYSSPHALVREFAKLWYDKELVVAFDWSHWTEGRELFRRSGPEKFADVSSADTLKLLTAVLRNDRFNDGALADLFASGDAQLLIKHFLKGRPDKNSPKLAAM